MQILSIGDRVRPGMYRLHSRFRRAINFTDGRRLVSLVTPDIGAGPANIVVQHLPEWPHRSDSSDGSDGSGESDRSDRLHRPGRLRGTAGSGGGGRSGSQGKPSRSRQPDPPPAPTLRVSRYSVVFAKRRFSFSHAQSYRSPLYYVEGLRPAVFRKKLSVVERKLIASAHPKSVAFLLDRARERSFRMPFERAFLAQIKDGARRMLSVRGVRRLAGCGFGLTPSGDDFIAGSLIGLNLLQRLTGRSHRALIRRLFAAARGANRLSNSFLELARDGRVTESVQKLVASLFQGKDREIRRRAQVVMAAGETSGADLLTGFVLTVKRYV